MGNKSERISQRDPAENILSKKDATANAIRIVERITSLGQSFAAGEIDTAQVLSKTLPYAQGLSKLADSQQGRRSS